MKDKKHSYTVEHKPSIFWWKASGRQVCIFHLLFLEGFATEVWHRFLVLWAQREWKTNMTFQHVLNVFHQSRQMRRSVAFGWTVHSVGCLRRALDGEWEVITRWRWLVLSAESGWSSHFSLIAIQTWTYSHELGVNKCSVRTTVPTSHSATRHRPLSPALRDVQSFRQTENKQQPRRRWETDKWPSKSKSNEINLGACSSLSSFGPERVLIHASTLAIH